MASKNVDMTDSDTTSTLSEPLGTDTLEARSMIPEGLRNTPDTEGHRSLVWIDSRQFFKVDHATTATQCERTFSSAKNFITPERNRLGDDIIEATQCLKAW